MQFSYRWLTQYFEALPAVEEVAAKLTAVGLAVEKTDSHGDDTWLEIEVTSNRADCMSHLGLAREVGAGFGTSVLRPEVGDHYRAEAGRTDSASVEIADAEGCPRYAAVVLRGVKVGPSPDWLVERLETVGVRAINNIVDVTNYVLWETGQPLHAFDLEKLGGRSIVVRRGRAGEQLVTLDGEKRDVDPEMLLIADAEQPVALAGVMGGADSEVSMATTDVLIESAHFEPALVRRTARRVGLHTDASHRFERGADPEGCLDAALRAAELMVEVAGGTVEPAVIDARTLPTPAPSGRLELEKLNGFGGVEISPEFVETTMRALGFELESEAANCWRISVPSWRRFDFELDGEGAVYPAYFYEEVLRHWGFDPIASTLPSVEEPDLGASEGHRRRERLRRVLVACGLAETITYSFHAPEDDARFPGLSRDGEPAVLANPLSEQFSVMRRSLLPNLVTGALFNQRRGARAVRLFELGNLFPGGSSAEIESLGIVLGGDLGSPWEGGSALDFFDLKGIVQTLAETAGVELSFAPAEIGGLIQGTACELRVADDDGLAGHIGYMGQVDDKEPAFPLFVLELATAPLACEQVAEIAAPSRFPGVRMDTTLTHPLDVPWREIAAAIEAAELEHLLEFGLKVRYQGAGVPEGAVNTTISFHYGADDRSLTQDEVNDRHGGLASALIERFGHKD